MINIDRLLFYGKFVVLLSLKLHLVLIFLKLYLNYAECKKQWELVNKDKFFLIYSILFLCWSILLITVLTIIFSTSEIATIKHF